MLSADALVDEGVLLSILESGHSRVPVHKPGSRCGSPWPSHRDKPAFQGDRAYFYTAGSLTEDLYNTMQ